MANHLPKPATFRTINLSGLADLLEGFWGKRSLRPLKHFFQKKLLRDKVLNILGLLSQSVSDDKDLFYDAEEIWEDLLHRGFSENDIESAIEQMEKMLLEVPGPYWSDQIPVVRCFTKDEAARLSPRIQGYLWQLKTRGIIDHALEDEIVHRVMNLEDPTGLREIKTVVALTLFSHEHKIQLDRGDLSISDSLLN